jgi:hypothetical protein
MVDILSKGADRAILEYSKAYPLEHKENFLSDERTLIKTSSRGLKRARRGHPRLE